MIYTFSLLLALIVAFLQAGEPTPEGAERIRREAEVAADKHRQAAIRLNDLAGHIQTEADARSLVDGVAEMFADHLPRFLATHEVRTRVAKAEYRAATDPAQLLSDERIATVWNDYVREIGAADEALVTADELHSLRDLKHASANLMWSRGWNQSIWTMPNVYALTPGGKVADGCRALEALAVLYDLDSHFENLRTARKLAKEGIVASDQIQRSEERRSLLDEQGVRTELHARASTLNDNPVRTAERGYIAEHGVEKMYKLLHRLLDQFFPSS